MKLNQIMPVLLLTLLSVTSTGSMAANSTGTMKTTASIDKTCSFTVTDMHFGELNASSLTNPASGQISVLCNKNASYNITLNYGNPQTSGIVSGGRYNAGLMTGAIHKDTIAYGIQIGSTFNFSGLNWINPVAFVATGNVDTINLVANATFGYMGTKRYPAADNYLDTNTIVLNF